MPAAEQTEVLRPKLQEAQRALDAALDEACETDIERADTTDLIRLEESLTIAREAARTVIGVLQRLVGKSGELEEVQPPTHRIFIDNHGVQWDAFAVYPSRATKGRSSLPAPYDKGWLALQCPEGLRRLTPIPETWKECSREEFCQILDKATAVPRRMHPSGTADREKGKTTST